MDTRKLSAARLWAAKTYPYLATALFACKIISVPQIKTVAVDRNWRLYIDPELVDTWTTSQTGAMLVHHTGHLLRDHFGRGTALGITKENAKHWTLAADAEVNDDLVDLDLDAPLDPVVPQSFGEEPGKFAEEYYRKLETEDTDLDCPECGSGVDGLPREWDLPGEGGVSENAAFLLRCQVAEEILKSQRAGLLPGTVPSSLARWAEEFLKRKIDWRKLLAAELRRGIGDVSGRVDYLYARPSRRQSIFKDVVMPALRKPIPDVAVVIDTSGSMSEKQLGRILAEVEGLVRSVGVTSSRLRVLTCDAAVHTVQKVSSSRQVRLEGGGGTNMGEGIEQALRLRPPPKVIVVLTDGYTPWPTDSPRGAKVVVGLIRDEEMAGWDPPGWARVVRIEEDVA